MTGIIDQNMIPAGECFQWQGKLIWINASGNVLNALVLCFLIPGIVFYFSAKRRDIIPLWACLLFVLPLVFGGISYALMLANIWFPNYWLSGLAKNICGLASLCVAVLLLKAMPKLLKIPSPRTSLLNEGKIDRLYGFLRPLMSRKANVDTHRSGEHLDMVDVYVRELAQMKKDLEQSNAAQSRFLANMSHEIRTPLAGIMGYSDQLLFDQSLRYQHREMVESIKKCTSHLKFLLNDILDVSKIEAGKLIIQKEPCSFMALLHDVLAIMQGKMIAKDLALKIIFDTPIPDRIFTDPLRLRQILINVIGNAVKFTDSGFVTLRISAHGFSSNSRTGTLELSVIDTGCGIPLEFQSEMFKRFSQAESAFKMRNAGSGLGLFLSRTLARQLGGDVILKESRPGEGSEFRISLTLDVMYDTLFIEDFIQSQAKTEATVIPNPIEGKLDGLSILVVEDGVDNQRIFSHFLKMAGARITILEDGMSALERVWSDDSFDLILMDIQIPILDGYEVTDRLRKGGYQKPIIAVTAHSLQGEKPMGSDIGISDFLAKPVEIEKLIHTIQLHAGRTKRQLVAEEPVARAIVMEIAEEPEIRSKYHDSEIYREIIIAFIKSFEERITDIQNQIDQSDWEKLRYSLHQVKGAAATYGFPMVSEMAGQMEDSVKNFQSDAIALLSIRNQAEQMKGISLRMKGGLASLEHFGGSPL